MRLYQLGTAIFQKYVPMPKQEEISLQNEAEQSYIATRDDAIRITKLNSENAIWNENNKNNADFVPRPIEKLKISHKVVTFLDLWFIRYFIGAIFIFIDKKIKEYNNSTSDYSDNHDDDDDELEDLIQLVKLRKQRRINGM